MADGEDKVSEQDLTELEQIGENLPAAKAPAAGPPGEPDKNVLLTALRDLQKAQPDLVKPEYWKAYRLMLQKGLTHSETAREADLNRGAMLRAFDRIKLNLKDYVQELKEDIADEERSADGLSEAQSWIKNCSVDDLNWKAALERLTLEEIDELLQTEKRKTAVFKLKTQRKRLAKRTTQPEAESFHVETEAPTEVPTEIPPTIPAEDFETVPRERIVYLSPENLDAKRWQPRTTIEVSPEFVRDIERAGGNTVAILVQEGKIGQQSAVVDGHRRRLAIQKINETRDKKNKMLVKCLVRPMTDEEAAFAAMSANTGSEALSPEDRDKWVFRMVAQMHIPRERVMFRYNMADTTISNIIRAFEKTAKPIRDLLDRGQITVGHAKAVASLPETEQKRIARSIEHKLEKAETGAIERPSVRDVEQQAQKAKLKLDSRAKLTEYLKGLKDKKIKAKTEWDAHRQIVQKVFGGGLNDGYVVQAHDINYALKQAGVELVLSQEEPKTEEKPAKLPICTGCIANYSQTKTCLVGCEYPQFESCAMYLPTMTGSPNQWWEIPICGFCGGSTLHYHTGDLDDTPTVEEYDDDGHTRRVNHGFCVVQEAVKTGRLTGLCESCANPCPIVREVRRRDGLSLSVSKCVEFDAMEKQIDDVNRAALAFHQRLATEAAKTAERASKNGGNK